MQIFRIPRNFDGSDRFNFLIGPCFLTGTFDMPAFAAIKRVNEGAE